MYFFKYQPIKERLKNPMISDREALPYLLVFVSLQALVLSLPDKSEMNIWDIIEKILMIISTVAGMFYVYKKNGGGAGYDIIQKYVILGWIVVVRFALFILPVGSVLVALAYYQGGDENTFIKVVISVSLYLIYRNCQKTPSF